MTISEPIVDHLVAATQEVFETFLAMPITARPPVTGPLEVPANVVATVAFAGHRRGLVAVYSSLSAARRITGGMLGIPPDEVNGEVPDAMGEIANMVAGTFRNRLTRIEPASEISVPTVTIGTEFATLYTSAVQRLRCPFDLGDDQVSVELILTGEQG